MKNKKSTKTKSKSRTKSKESSKKFSWEDYKLVFIDKDEEENSKKRKKKRGKRLAGRDFDGSWTEKGVAHGPASAGGDGMATGVGGAGAAAGISVDAGFGVGGFGASAFGEASQRLAKYFSSFVGKLKATGKEKQLLDKIMDGYNDVFDTVAYNTSVIMCGFQPELVDYMDFDVDALVLALNEFSGDIISVYLGDHNNMISKEKLSEWYEYMGVKSEVIDSIIFVEKTNKAIDNESSIFDLSNKKGKADTMNQIEDVSWVHALHKSILIGCSDPYLMGEMMVALSTHEAKFEVDKRFIYAI
jgi:hypothetical protein